MFCLRLSWTKAVTSQQHLMRGLDLEGLGSTHFVFFGCLKSGKLGTWIQCIDFFLDYSRQII